LKSGAQENQDNGRTTPGQHQQSSRRAQIGFPAGKQRRNVFKKGNSKVFKL